MSTSVHTADVQDLRRRLVDAREDCDQAEQDYREAWRLMLKAADRWHRCTEHLKRLEAELTTTQPGRRNDE